MTPALALAAALVALAGDQRDRGARVPANAWLVGAVACVLASAQLGPISGVALGLVLGAGARFGGARSSTRRAEERSRRIRQRLPDALDLLAGVVEAGATLDSALAAVGARVGGDLGAELSACAARLGAGRRRRDAFRDLGASCSELARIADALATADELGAPIADALREQALLQRDLRRLAVREQAAAAAPKLALIVGLVLVPSALVLVLGAQLLAMLDDATL